MQSKDGQDWKWKCKFCPQRFLSGKGVGDRIGRHVDEHHAKQLEAIKVSNDS